MSSREVCATCLQPSPSFHCGLCQTAQCDDCVQQVSEGEFSYLKRLPPELSHRAYCGVCYGEKTEPALESYRETVERAKNVFVFYTTQRKAIPLIRRTKETLRVEECPDRDETILRLAFFAAEQKFNAIVDVEVVSEKVRDGSYQTSKWKGTAYPAQVDADKLERQYLRDQIWR